MVFILMDHGLCILVIKYFKYCAWFWKKYKLPIEFYKNNRLNVLVDGCFTKQMKGKRKNAYLEIRWDIISEKSR